MLARRGCEPRHLHNLLFTYKAIAKPNKKKQFRRNEQIRVPQVRVIDEHNKQLGVMNTNDAIVQAKQRGLDLVEVSPLIDPPVCKYVNFGQLQYEQRKQQRKQRSMQKRTEVKGIRLSTTISDHDFDVRVKRAAKFIEKGHKIQVELMLRGRQKAHPEIGQEVVQRFVDSLEETAKVESPVNRKGSKYLALIAPK